MEPEVSLENFVFSHFPELDEDFEDQLNCLPDTVQICGDSENEGEPASADDGTSAHDAMHFTIDFNPDSE